MAPTGRPGSGPADRGRRSALVAAMAADANRPTSSLVSFFSATDAASVPSYLPTAATTGSVDSRSGGRDRSSAANPAPIPLVWPSRPSVAAASSSASTRRSMRPTPRRPRRRAPSTRRRRPSPSPGPPGRASPPAHRTAPRSPRGRRRRRSRTCRCCGRPRSHGYFVTASSAARVRFSPALRPCESSTFGSSRVRMRKFCALPSKPPKSIGDLVERALPVVPVRRVADVVGEPGEVDEVGVAAQPDRHARGRSGPPRANGSAGCAASRSAADRRPGSCRPACAGRHCAAPWRGRGRSRCGVRCRCPAVRHPSAPRPPGAGGRSRRMGRGCAYSPTHSLPGPFAGLGCPGRDAR